VYFGLHPGVDGWLDNVVLKRSQEVSGFLPAL